MAWYEFVLLSLLVAGAVALVIWWARAPRFAGARATTRRATGSTFCGIGHGLTATGRGIARGGRWAANSHRVRNAARWVGSNILTVLALLATAFIVWWILHRMGVVGGFIWFTLKGWAVMVLLVSMWIIWLAPRQARERLNLQLYGDEGRSLQYDNQYRHWRRELQGDPPPVPHVDPPATLWGRIYPIAFNNDWLFWVPFLLMFFCLFTGIGMWAAGHRPEGLWDIASRQWLETDIGRGVCEGWQRFYELPTPGVDPCAPDPISGQFGTWFWLGVTPIYFVLSVLGIFLAFREEAREGVAGFMRRMSGRLATPAQGAPAQAGHQGGGDHQHRAGLFLFVEGVIDFIASFAAEYAANRAVRGRVL